MLKRALIYLFTIILLHVESDANVQFFFSFAFFFLMLWNVNVELMRYLPPWLRVQIFVGFTLKAKQALDLSDLSAFGNLKSLCKKHGFALVDKVHYLK